MPARTKITKGGTISKRLRLEQANEIQTILHTSPWTTADLYEVTRARDWRSFPYGYVTFVAMIHNPGKMANHFDQHPALFELIKDILANDPE